MHADLIKYRMPAKAFARLLEAMADLEYRLNFATVERIQVGSGCSECSSGSVFANTVAVVFVADTVALVFVANALACVRQAELKSLTFSSPWTFSPLTGSCLHLMFTAAGLIRSYVV